MPDFALKQINILILNIPFKFENDAGNNCQRDQAIF